ncbi:PREDICTED: rano class II histocompatibility antigen, A beta chain-like [Cyprinodon variegatus]|uniref:rano class II histocompatibility antigen, A beta chain-like n=1 Tax=Cyprinodon variegatus TaxID=28743 RepID=UPI0007428DCC|nr:PREDICTED: rano class II histocompatibility antigen, A beta chain-like [Cyprinodon variegatus]
MNTQSFLFIFFLSLENPVFSHEDFYQVRACCAFNGPNFNNIEYTIMTSFNKQNMMQYNSTRGNWIGFTQYSHDNSYYWNKDPADALQRVLQKKLLCYDNLHHIRTMGNLSTTPTIRIKSLIKPDGRHPALLICSAYNFYPKQIQLTWLRNNQQVTKGVTYSDVIPVGDLYYHFHSHLEYSPAPGEKISCMVEHLTMSEPRVVVWDDSLPKKEKTKIVVGLIGLILGLVILISGFIYHKQKSAVYNSICQGEDIEGNQLKGT